MRATPWFTTALLLFGCAPGGQTEPPAGEPATTGAGPSAGPAAAGVNTVDPDGGVSEGADAGAVNSVNPGAPPGPCDPSLDPAAGVSISATGACPAVMPKAPACAAQLVLCGSAGTFAAAATGDSRGSLALACGSADSGLFFNLFVPRAGRFVSAAPLGYQAWNMGDGFVAKTVAGGPPRFDLRAHDGTVEASLGTTRVLAGEGFALAVDVASNVSARAYGTDGTPRGETRILGVANGVVMAGGAAAQGRALVIWQTYGAVTATARWVDSEAAPLGPAFSIGGWTDHVPQPAALPDGSIALRRDDGSWRSVVHPEAVTEGAAPGWLAARGNFAIARGALIFGTEVLAADGTSCGTLNLGAPLVGVGADGTAVTAPDSKTFRIYPQFLR